MPRAGSRNSMLLNRASHPSWSHWLRNMVSLRPGFNLYPVSYCLLSPLSCLQGVHCCTVHMTYYTGLSCLLHNSVQAWKLFFFWQEPSVFPRLGGRRFLGAIEIIFSGSGQNSLPTTVNHSVGNIKLWPSPSSWLAKSCTPFVLLHREKWNRIQCLILI